MSTGYRPQPAWEGWGPEFDRLAAGDIASSTERRLKELVRWGGFSSFMSPSALGVATDADIQPIGQVIGLCVGQVLPGRVRTTRPGQGRARLGTTRRRERTGLVTAWTALRRRALARLEQQATILGAHAVVGIEAEREYEPAGAEEFGAGQMRFSGTAVRVRALARAPVPVLTLASAQELWAMLRAGLEPAGIAGGFAAVETRPSAGTVNAAVDTMNAELEDVTESVYEVRRLAMERLVADARSLKADGLLGVSLQLEHDEPGRFRLPGLKLAAHVLGSAVRRTRPVAVEAEPVLQLSEGAG